jgi:tetratricopeptide (TPR) repeat protein
MQLGVARSVVSQPGSWVLVYVGLMFGFVWLRYARRVAPFWAARRPFLRGDYDLALRRLALLERLGLKTPTLLHFKGTVLMFAGRNPEAEHTLRECLARESSPVHQSLAMVNLGYVMLGQRRYDEARQSLEGAIKLRPNGAVAYSSLAETYLQQGIEPQKALELVDRGIELKQNSEMQARVDEHIFGYLFANRAWALFLLGRAVEADAALDEALKFSAAPSKAGAAGVQYHVARALVAAGQIPQAREHFRKARETDPKGRYAALAEAALREFV